MQRSATNARVKSRLFAYPLFGLDYYQTTIEVIIFARKWGIYLITEIIVRTLLRENIFVKENR